MINGYLMGENYEVAFRRLPPHFARDLRGLRPGLAVRALTAFLFTIPLINLITPVLATAAMVHLFSCPGAEYEALSTG